MASHTTGAICKSQEPATLTKVKSYFALCSIFTLFVPNSRRVSSQFPKGLRKSQSKELGLLTKKEPTALNTLKEKFVSPPILTVPMVTGQYTFDTDLCNRHIGCALFQKEDDGETKRIGSRCRTLTNQEKNLYRSCLECHAVVWAVLLVSPVLKGLKFPL